MKVRSTVPHDTRAQVLPRSLEAIDRLVVLSDELEIGRRLARETIVFQAQRVEQRIGRSAAAALDLGGIAVDMLLVEPAVIEIALHRPMVGHVVAAVEREQLRSVLCSLRPGEDRPVVVVEQLERRRPDHAEIVVGGRRDEVDLGVGALPAEIAIEAREPRRRLVAPAVVLEPLRRGRPTRRCTPY